MMHERLIWNKSRMYKVPDCLACIMYEPLYICDIVIWIKKIRKKIWIWISFKFNFGSIWYDWNPYMWDLFPIYTQYHVIYLYPYAFVYVFLVIDVYVSFVNIFWTHMFIFLLFFLYHFHFGANNDDNKIWKVDILYSLPRENPSLWFNDRHWTTIVHQCENI